MQTSFLLITGLGIESDGNNVALSKEIAEHLPSIERNLIWLMFDCGIF